MAPNTPDTPDAPDPTDDSHVADDEAPSPKRAPVDPTSWSQIWHLPLLLMGLVMMTLGVYMALPDAPSNEFADAFKSVEHYLEAHEFEKAEQKLKEIETPVLEAQDSTAWVQGRYWQLGGDLLYLRNQKHLPLLHDKVLQAIISYYHRADEKLAGELSDQSRQYLAQAMVALGKTDEALAIVDKLQTDKARDRYEIVKSLIDYHIQRGALGRPGTLESLLDRFRSELENEEDPNRRFVEEVWLTQLEARQYLDAYEGQGAIDYLLRRITQLDEAQYTGHDRSKAEVIAPLRVALGHAYQQAGEFDQAQVYYEFAQGQIKEDAALNADILVGLGQVALAQSQGNNVTEALGYFIQAVKDFPSETTYVSALIGAGDCQARLETYPDAIGHFREAVERLCKMKLPGDPRKKHLTNVVTSHMDYAMDADQFEMGFKLLRVLGPLYEPDLPATLLHSFAKINELVAEDYLKSAERFDPRKAASDAVEDHSKFGFYNRKAAGHFTLAADYYWQHARAMTREDDEEHKQSLWKAATSYDKAQHWDKAVEVYVEFVTTRPDDPKRLEAKKHLGKAYMAMEPAQYQVAIDQFADLQRTHPKHPQTLDSKVPLARALAALGQKDPAENILQKLVNDHPVVRPDSRQYRDALIALGKLLYQRLDEKDARTGPAIEQLKLAVDRYGDSDDGATLRFLLADAYRKSIPALDADLAQQRSDQEQLTLSAERKQRLEQAQMYYNQTLNLLEAQPPVSLNPLEREYLRNSYFYQADCAYDRGHYETAISLYDQAARRWEHHPSSLLALVQIVNAHCELGQFAEARTANSKASWQLERIPDEAFDDPSLPMSRHHWEDWMRWRNQLNLFADGGR